MCIRCLYVILMYPDHTVSKKRILTQNHSVVQAKGDQMKQKAAGVATKISVMPDVKRNRPVRIPSSLSTRRYSAPTIQEHSLTGPEPKTQVPKLFHLRNSEGQQCNGGLNINNVSYISTKAVVLRCLFSSELKTRF